MMKNLILATVAVAALAAGTVAQSPKAEAGYGFSVGYSGGHHNGFSFGWGNGYGYRPHCSWETYPVTIKVYDPYYHTYVYKTIYKSRKVCY